MLFNKKKKSIISKIFKKRSKIEKFYDRNEEFFKYSLVSLICTGILYLIFYFVDLITKGNYLLANFLSYTISFTILYIWDMKIFKSRPIRKKEKFKQVMIFIIIRVIGFPIDSFILSIFINKFRIGNLTSKILSSLIMFMYNYLTNKLFVFKNKKLL